MARPSSDHRPYSNSHGQGEGRHCRLSSGFGPPASSSPGLIAKNLFFEVIQTKSSKEKLSLLADRLEQAQGATIVYTGTRKSVESIVESLDRQDIEALRIPCRNGG